MSSWISYDSLVDLVRDHHREAYSGLVTGISERKHSFRIGFDQGDIVLLSYRVKSGMDALPFFMQIERAKIIDHPSMDITQSLVEQLDTSRILTQLTTHSVEQEEDITDVGDESSAQPKTPATEQLKLDSRVKKAIEAAAVHHFGPIGAMVCEEHLANPDGDLRTVILRIARDVEASQADTEAFIESIGEP